MKDPFKEFLLVCDAGLLIVILVGMFQLMRDKQKERDLEPLEQIEKLGEKE